MAIAKLTQKQELVRAFRSEVADAATRPSFIHHPWYLRYHLEIVESLAFEFAARYPNADRELVSTLVWLHDYGKIFEPERERQARATITKGGIRLNELGFEKSFVNQALSGVDQMDRSTELDLSAAEVEVQIVSSADGCSHLVGPFMHLWWWEHADQPFTALMTENRRKAVKDWNHKIVLPEARAAFEARFNLILEQSGNFPERFLN